MREDAKEMAENGNGVRQSLELTWSNIVITVALVLSLAGGGWTIFQNQFGSLEKEVALSRTDRKEADGRQTKEIAGIREDLKKLQKDYVTQEEHKAFKQLVEDRTSLLQKNIEFSMPKDQFNVWNLERSKSNDLLAKQVDQHDIRIIKLNDRLTEILNSLIIHAREDATVGKK